MWLPFKRALYVTGYATFHFAVTLLSVDIMQRRQGQNIFWPTNAILAAAIINADSKRVKFVCIPACAFTQSLVYLIRDTSWFYWLPVNILESTALGFLLPWGTKLFTANAIFNVCHARHILMFTVVTIFVCVSTALIGAGWSTSIYRYNIAEFTTEFISWSTDDVLGALVYMPFMCCSDYGGIWRQLTSTTGSRRAFMVRWGVIIVLILMSFSKLISLDFRIDVLRVVINIPLLMFLAGDSPAGLSLVTFALTGTINAFFNDFGTDYDRAWARFYMFWAQICNLCFVSLFYSRRKLQETIEERVKTRTEEINDLRQKAIENSVKKAELLSYISHEIRNPLHALRNMVECIASTPNLPQEAKKYVDNLRMSNTFILDLVTNVLDVNKLEANKFTVNYSPTDIVSLLHTIISHTETQCSSHNIHFRPTLKFEDLPARIECDAVKIQQILYNLISNALKYTPPDGEICLAASYNDNVLCVTIEDDGVGMPSDTLQHLFEPYVQATSAKPGTGLGLVICKAFIEKMNGTITVTSTLDHGTKFIVKIPAVISSQEPAVKDTTSVLNISPNQLKVLIVDDERVNRLVAGKMLTRMGFQVVEAENGLDALTLYDAEKPFAFVLSDIHMPVLNGKQLLTELRARRNDPVPFILVSGDEVTDEVACLILQKPFTVGDLSKIIRENDLETLHPRPTPTSLEPI